LTCFLCTGLDYVGHEDVLPYKTTQKQPIFNHLFDKFLVASDTDAGIIVTNFFAVVDWYTCRGCVVRFRLGPFYNTYPRTKRFLDQDCCSLVALLD